jgi:hypothetical protein
MDMRFVTRLGLDAATDPKISCLPHRLDDHVIERDKRESKVQYKA